MRVPRLVGVLALLAAAGCTHQPHPDDNPRALNPGLVAAAAPLPAIGAPWTPPAATPGATDLPAAPAGVDPTPSAPDPAAPSPNADGANTGAVPAAPDGAGAPEAGSTRTGPTGQAPNGRNTGAPPARRDTGAGRGGAGEPAPQRVPAPPHEQAPAKTRKPVPLPPVPDIDPKVICDMGERVWAKDSPEQKTCRSVYG